MDEIVWDPERFEWDPQKAAANLRDRDGVSFEEATTVFRHPRLQGPVFDAEHTEDDDEDRWIVRGESVRGRPLVVIYCERGSKKRIISAWKLTGRDLRHYHEAEEQSAP